MSISVSESVNLFFSERTNKTLILIYLTIYSLMMLPYMMYSYTKDPQYILPGYLLYFLALFFLPGVQVMTVNNIINGKESVVPGFNEFPQILLNGLKTVVWSIAVAFIVMIPAFVLFFFGGMIAAFSKKPVLVMVVCTLILTLFLIIITLRYTIPAYCYFTKNLKFISLFHIPRILNFMKNRNYCYGSYLLKIIGVSLLYFILIAVLFFSVCFVVFLTNGIHGDIVPDKLILPLYFLYIVACGLFGFAIYIPMTAQFVNSAEDDEEFVSENPEDDDEDDFI